MAFLDFFRPRWKHSDPYIRITAIPALTDHMTLCTIAVGDPSREVREAANARLREIEEAAKQAQSEAAERQRTAGVSAVMTLTDQRALAAIAMRAGYPEDARELAAERLTDQTALAAIATTVGYPANVRGAAANKLTDQALLVQLAKAKEWSSWVAYCAVRNPNLHDETMLAEIAKTAAEDGVREDAIKRLTDRALLEDVGNNVSHHRLRDLVALRLGSGDTWCPGCKTSVAVRKSIDDSVQEFLSVARYCRKCGLEV